MRELIIATVGAAILIAIGLATINQADGERSDASSAMNPDSTSPSMSLKLAD